MTEPTTFRELREQAEKAGRQALYDKGAELNAPSYSKTCRTNIDDWTCPACKETIRRREFGTAFAPCACLDKAYIDAKLASIRQQRPGVVDAELSRGGVNRLYLTASFADFKPRAGTKDALKACQTYAADFDPDNPAGLRLMGPTGTGKTHLAIAALRAIMEDQDLTPLFVEAVHMLAEVWRQRFKDDDPLQRYIQAPLLVLDDVGNHEVTPQAQDQIYRVITGRYNAGRPTILTTNCQEEELQGLISDAFWSRLQQMKQVPVVADDYRAREVRDDG